VLLSTLVICIPLATLAAVVSKFLHAWRAGLLAAEAGPKAAFARYRFGLASAEDRRELRAYFESLAATAEAEADESSEHAASFSFRSTWAGVSSSPATGPAMGVEMTALTHKKSTHDQ
jgi:hypothetical protein